MDGSFANDFAGTPRFEVIARIGEGAVGVVYAALDREQNAPVALKTLRAPTPEAILLIKNEFREVQDLGHPNLVHLGELFEERGFWFFTMELVKGEDFLAYVRPRATGLDVSRLRSATEQLARGLAALHAAGKVHRDVKPSNVLVTRASRVVVLDFGIVTDVRRQGSVQCDLALGTASYMAPEQAASEPVGPPADLYAVGVMLFEALTGRLPFEGTVPAILEAKVTREPPPPSTLAPGIPPDLDALSRDLLRMDPAARPTAEEVLRRLSGDTSARDVLTRASLFVGRQREQNVLFDAFDALRGGEGRVVFVHGESGVGKSALVRRFVDRLGETRPPPLVLSGRCYERESVPYKAVDAVVDALSRHVTEAYGDRARQLLPEDAALLCQVFPVLRQVPAFEEAARAVPPELAQDAPRRRARLFAAARSFVSRLAECERLVLVIDDLQWTDADSLALLAELLRPPRAPALLLVATIRTQTEAEGVRRPDALADALGIRPVHLRLGPLSSEQSRELAAGLLRGLGDGVGIDADAVAEEAGGHPLFIDALVRHRAAARGHPGPLRLDDALWERARALEPATRRLLELVAVAGVPLARRTAALAADLDVTSVDKRASELRAAHLLRSGSGPGGRGSDVLDVFHDRVREAVLARLEPEARRERHERLAEALGQELSADAELLAEHWASAGDTAKAALHARRAAEQAEGALAFERAARLYGMAIAATDATSKDQLALRLKLARALADAGRGAEAGEAFLAALPYASESEEIAVRQQAAEQLLKSGRVDQGLEILRRVLASAGMKLPTRRQALLSLGVRRLQLWMRGIELRAPEALSASDVLKMDVCRSAAIGLGMVDNVRAADFQTRGLLLALKSGDPRRVAVALSLEASFVSTRGQSAVPHVERLVERARALAERVGEPYPIAMAFLARGIGSVLAARFRGGLEAFDAAIAIFREKCSGVAWELESARLMALWCLWHLGEIEELRRRQPAYVLEAEAHGDLFAVTNYRTSYAANVHLAADEPERVRRDAVDAIRAWSQEGFHLQHYYSLYAQAQSHVYRGDGAAACELLESQWRDLERSLLLHIELAKTTILDLRARAALAAYVQDDGARRDAPSLLRLAQRDARTLVRMGTPISRPQGLLLLASIAACRGRSPEARTLATEAAEGFRREGLVLFDVAARRRLAELDGVAGEPAASAQDETLRARFVRNPARLVALLAPGFRSPRALVKR